MFQQNSTTRLSLLLCYYDFFVWFIMMLLHFFVSLSLLVLYIYLLLFLCSHTNIFCLAKVALKITKAMRVRNHRHTNRRNIHKMKDDE